MTSSPNDPPRQTRWRPHPEVMVQPMDRGAILLQLQTDRFFELNRTATRLWELLSEGCSTEQIKEQMLREFAVDAAQLEAEINALIAALCAQELVVPDA